MKIEAWGVEHNDMVVDAYPTQTEARLMCGHLENARPVPLCKYTPVTSHAGDLFQTLKDLAALVRMGNAPQNTLHAAARNAHELIREVERLND